MIANITDLKVSQDELAVYWLGNASFAIKNSNNDIIYIDPYLSNLAEKLYGFKRIMPCPIKAEDVRADYVLISHEHGDHFDVDSLKIIMSNNTSKLIGPKNCIEKAKNSGIKKDNLIKVKTGDLLSFDSFIIESVYADHGDLSPEALGYVLSFESGRIYYTGDTAYRPEKMEKAFSLTPEIVIAPINGEFGNLDPIEAAAIARDTRADVMIPSHFWMFAQHNGDLKKFIDCFNLIAEDSRYQLITLGDYYLHSF